VTKSTLNPQQAWAHKAIAAAGLEPDMVGDVSKLWWRNFLNKSSLRLTWPGFVWFTKKSKFAAHDIVLDKGITGKQMLQLERLFSDPYYLRDGHILVFGEQDAIMLQLHAGNLGQYLDNLQM
jgi:hypothetical protein